MRLVGLHIRLVNNIGAITEKVLRFKLPVFQSFVTTLKGGKLITPSHDEITEFNQQTAHILRRYLHVSYHANICEPNGIRILRRELELGEQLGFTHVVMHPGSGKWCGNKHHGIAVLVSSLNSVMAEFPGLDFLLENGAHGNFTVGGDITDFATVIEHLNFPDRIQFCIDTAHAYAFGYDIADFALQDAFIELLDNTVGIERITLFHLNDAAHPLGSFIDRHAVVGAGYIGQEALKRFALHPLLNHIPLVLELPALTEDEEWTTYHTINQWIIEDPHETYRN